MDPQTRQLIDYYAQRAPGFDRMYFDHPPGYLREAAELAKEIEDFARGRRALELACGTGHWTQSAARTAHFVITFKGWACSPQP